MPVMLSLKQLLTPISPDDALTSFLGTLQSFGFQATSWQSGSVQRTLCQGFTKIWSDLTFTVAGITGGMHPGLAQGEYMQRLALYSYKITPGAATPTIGTIRLTSSPAAPVNNWVNGGVLVADAPVGTNGANVYAIVGAGSIAPGTFQDLTFQAQVPGTAANIAPNVPLYLWSALTGVSATNPPITGSSTWITTPGTDAEADPAIGARCTGRFDRLTYGNTEGAYRAWVLETLPGSRVKVIEDPLVEGGIIITGATSTGPWTAGQITQISQYLAGTLDGKGRRPINDIVTVNPSTTLTLPALSFTVQCQGAFAADVAARITTALVALFGSIDIGGVILPGATVGKVLLSQLYSTIMAQQGLINVSGLPPGDIILGTTDIYVPAITVTVVTQ